MPIHESTEADNEAVSRFLIEREPFALFLRNWFPNTVTGTADDIWRGDVSKLRVKQANQREWDQNLDKAPAGSMAAKLRARHDAQKRHPMQTMIRLSDPRGRYRDLSIFEELERPHIPVELALLSAAAQDHTVVALWQPDVRSLRSCITPVFSHETWRDSIGDLIRHARAIIVVADKLSPGLEFDTVEKLGRVDRALIIVPPTPLTAATPEMKAAHQNLVSRCSDRFPYLLRIGETDLTELENEHTTSSVPLNTIPMMLLSLVSDWCSSPTAATYAQAAESIAMAHERFFYLGMTLARYAEMRRSADAAVRTWDWDRAEREEFFRATAAAERDVLRLKYRHQRSNMTTPSWRVWLVCGLVVVVLLLIWAWSS